ncbi:MAG: trigger factor [Halofilum sp. (in: g-proteobacteria)]|nr:trigger factor [Halofilum sp. (in: g-proteobacteria)]
MQVTVERNQGLERTVKVEIPASRIDDAVSERLQRLQRSVKLDGFRPGKVPQRVVRNRFGRQVRQEVLGELIQSTFQEAVNQESLQPAGQPRIEPQDEALEEGDFTYQATFEVFPEIELAPLSELQIERPVAEVTEADIDAMLETLRRQRQVFEAVERPAASGDRVVVDFAGRIDGEAFEGGSGENTPVDLGAGRMIEGFEEQLEGASAGETREVTVTFPEDYGSSELAGREAVFDVTVKEVQAGRLPEVDEEFIRGFGIESGSLDELRDSLRRNMERELRQALRTRIKQQVMDGLRARNPVDVPEALVEEETDRLRQQMKQQLGDQANADALPAELFHEEAHKRAHLGLILQELVRQAELKPDPERVQAQLDDLASSYEQPEQVIQYYRQNPQMMQGVEAMAVEEQLVDHVLEQAQVTETESSFDAIMNKRNEQQG